jgi:hypothetical protein
MTTIDRIILGHIAGIENRSVLQVAARLAAELDAELAGLFIRDETLSKAAALPIFLVHSRSLAGWEHVDQTQMEMALKTQAASLEASLSRTAEAMGISWSFRIVDGDKAVEEVSGRNLMLMPASLTLFEDIPEIKETTSIPAIEKYLSLLRTAGYRLFFRGYENDTGI